MCTGLKECFTMYVDGTVVTALVVVPGAVALLLLYLLQTHHERVPHLRRLPVKDRHLRLVLIHEPQATIPHTRAHSTAEAGALPKGKEVVSHHDTDWTSEPLLGLVDALTESHSDAARYDGSSDSSLAPPLLRSTRTTLGDAVKALRAAEKEERQRTGLAAQTDGEKTRKASARYTSQPPSATVLSEPCNSLPSTISSRAAPASTRTSAFHVSVPSEKELRELSLSEKGFVVPIRAFAFSGATFNNTED